VWEFTVVAFERDTFDEEVDDRTMQLSGRRWRCVRRRPSFYYVRRRRSRIQQGCFTMQIIAGTKLGHRTSTLLAEKMMICANAQVPIVARRVCGERKRDSVLAVSTMSYRNSVGRHRSFHCHAERIWPSQQLPISAIKASSIIIDITSFVHTRNVHKSLPLLLVHSVAGDRSSFRKRQYQS
jgi:hypothetical protein